MILLKQIDFLKEFHVARSIKLAQEEALELVIEPEQIWGLKLKVLVLHHDLINLSIVRLSN